MTPEGKVKAQIKKLLAANNADGKLWYHMPIGGMFARKGIPDFIGVFHGKPFAIEAKAGKEEPTKLQLLEHEAMRMAGCFVVVVYEPDAASFDTGVTGWTTLLTWLNKTKSNSQSQ